MQDMCDTLCQTVERLWQRPYDEKAMTATDHELCAKLWKDCGNYFMATGHDGNR